MKFTAKALEDLPDGKYTDPASPGLALRIRGKYKNWIFRRHCLGKAREVGLGSYPKLSIPEARRKAAVLTALDDEDFVSTIEKKKAVDESLGKQLTFRQAAERFAAWNIEVGNWKELDKAHKVFNGRMRMYIFLVIGDCLLDDITPAQVAAISKPIWHMPDTVDRCLRFTRQVFNWSIAKNLTSIPNPADKSGPLQYLLPRERHITKNRGAISVAELPALFNCIYDRFGNTASGRCFLFAVLTATRSGTARLATWEQIDLNNKEWFIPPEQLKMSEHGSLLVPLADAVIDWLKTFRPDNASGLLFQNGHGGALSDSMVSRLIKDSGENWIDVAQTAKLGKPVRPTLHGVARATFRTWSQDDRLGNDKRFDPRIAELCLHHKVKDIYKGAYERNEHFKRRREMMNEWATYCFSSVKSLILSNKNY